MTVVSYDMKHVEEKVNFPSAVQLLDATEFPENNNVELHVSTSK